MNVVRNECGPGHSQVTDISSPYVSGLLAACFEPVMQRLSRNRAQDPRYGHCFLTMSPSPQRRLCIRILQNKKSCGRKIRGESSKATQASNPSSPTSTESSEPRKTPTQAYR